MIKTYCKPVKNFDVDTSRIESHSKNIYIIKFKTN